MATGQVTAPPRSPSPTPPKRGFFNKLIKRKNVKKDGSKGLSRQSSDSNRPNKDRKLVVARSKSTNRGRNRSNSTLNRNSYVDNDEFSLYNEDELESSTIVSTDESSVESFDQSFATGVPTFQKPPQSLTFDNHLASEQVKFPNIETYFPEGWKEKDEEPPWSGITFESFINPKYVKVSRRHKQSPRVLNNLFLAQELNMEHHDPGSRSREGSVSDEELGSIDGKLSEEDDGLKCSNNEIFVMEFSKDGKYLAAAGRDSAIKIWKVISSPLGRLEYSHKMKQEGVPPQSNKRDPVFHSAPVFHQSPVRIFKGHTQNVLSLAWSKNNFLISGSMDKTVRLWHVDRPKCLQVFQHEDFVTSVKFHPLDDRFFLSGSLDNHVRLWSILEKSISYTKNLGEDVLITALEFTPDGNLCVVGGFNGSVFVMETKGLFVLKRFEVKERSLVNAFHSKTGNKITGIKVFVNPFYIEGQLPKVSEIDKWAVLITTNDSKVRMISTTSKKLITRFKGLTNNSSSIQASSSEDGKYIIAGSEDHYCYIWENNSSIINNKLKQSLADLIDRTQHATDLHTKINKIIPAHIRKLLDEDKNEFIANENNSYSCFHAHHSKCNVAIFAPENTRKILQSSDDIIYDLEKRGDRCKFESAIHEGESKTIHKDKTNDPDLRMGHIVVTTDQFGLIRVFRQDSSREYRKKFVDCYKRCQSSTKTSYPNTPIDGFNQIGAMAVRSLSPSQVLDPSKQIRDILSTGMKVTTSTLNPQNTINGIAAIPKVISSSSIMNLKQAARNRACPKPIKSHSDDVLMASKDGFYSNKNGSEVTLNAIPNQKAKVISPTEQFPTMGAEFIPSSIPVLITNTDIKPSNESLSSHQKLENLKISRSNSRGRAK
ncbi:uncharacterized protein SPAPADRAFT_51169 [Spathaspora passalidarum NRRL Y-27907]|uniref:WD40 repeat-like protein n=1 Tax=Spathaspora passalidarum (strain NRRL Y-27907 / 11-Y1) TaxID=619300 RepID=G3AP62_SPAPN|nr:uncharacterized protein SPAPADRAFT_51169 [Spathaspora passalidarum NRRL Y-27907]EGW32633.1 hypothetical protein SPAPADRAFT_51169 [Spathaspora passalidarum NRRL Y-27907]